MLTRRSFTRPTIALLAVFVVLSVLVVLELILPFDVAVLEWMGTIRRPWLTDVMLFFTFIGNGAIEVPLALLATYVMWRIGRPLCAKRYVLAALSAEVVYAILKPSFQRDRPRIIERLADAGWYSYPSGHAMLAPVIYGFALILLAKSVRSRSARSALLLMAMTIPPLIALSRVYLGVHYPSDVVGALFLGNAWVLLWSEVAPLASDTDESSPLTSTK